MQGVIERTEFNPVIPVIEVLFRDAILEEHVCASIADFLRHQRKVSIGHRMSVMRYGSSP